MEKSAHDFSFMVGALLQKLKEGRWMTVGRLFGAIDSCKWCHGGVVRKTKNGDWDGCR